MKLVKVTFLFFCLWSLFQTISCTKQTINKSSETYALDSVNFFIQKMKDNNLGYSTRLQSANTALQYSNSLNLDSILRYKVYLLGNLRQFDSAIHISRKLIELGRERNDSIILGQNYPIMAYYFNLNKQKDSAFKYYNLTKTSYLKYNDSISNGRYMLDLAILQSDYGDYNGSDDTGTLALSYSNDNDSLNSASVYNCWAISSRKQKDFKSAINYYEKAIELTTSITNKIIYKNNIANIYRDLREYDKSISILINLKANPLVSNINKARITDNLAYTKWLANKNEIVLPELQNALTIRLQENDLHGSIASYFHLAEYYEDKNQKISLSYALKMYQTATIQNSPQDKLEALQKLIQLDYNTSKTKEYYNTYVRINDSLQVAKQTAQNKYAKIKYESEKNQKENLQYRIDKAADQLEIEKQEKWNLTLFFLGGVSFIVFFSFLYYRKKKHQQEKRAEVYKTETRIAKKIHDEVANDVVNVMNKLQYTNITSTQLLDDLESIYLLTRDISHENNSIETGAKFENYLKNMLASYNHEHTTIIIKDIHNVGLVNLATEKQIEIYRALQEIMVNMRKHSKASLVVVNFTTKNNKYLINYSDNGIGADPTKFKLNSGLKHVETRIEEIQGTITFETGLNKGFKIFIRFKK